MNPIVSIILPTYNRSHKIQGSVRSLLTQTYKNFEIIIVDDGSEDDTEYIIGDLEKKDSRIRYIKHQHRQGANAARNSGVRQAQGEYIAFQDSDDQWLPQKLATQMDAIQNTGVQAAFTSFWRIHGQKRTYIPKYNRQIKAGAHAFHQEILEGNFITLPTFLVKKSLFLQAGGFDEKLPRFQDWELFLRLSKITLFIYIKKPLVNAYLGGDNITTNRSIYRKALEYIIQKHREDFKANPVALTNQYLNLAADALKSREFKQAATYISHAFRPGIKPLAKLVTQRTLPRLQKKTAQGFIG